MNKKVFVLIVFLSIASCGFFIDRSILNSPNISLKILGDPVINKGRLIAVNVVSQNSTDPTFCKYRQQAQFNVFYTINKQSGFDPKLISTKTNEHFPGSGSFKYKGRFKISSEDIYLIHKGKKLAPELIFSRQPSNVISNVLESNITDYFRFVSFPLPCTKLLDPGTKLIIKRIYKDDKVIKENIEFGFIKSDNNQGYSIWLE